MEVVFLNGEFIEADKAKVSIFDTGFYYGDGIYEVALLYQGKAIDLDSHLARLEYVLAQVKFKGTPSISELKKVIHELLLRNSSVKCGMIYVQITRGIMENRYLNPLTLEKPTIIAYIMPVPIEFDITKKYPLKCKVEFDPRRERRDIKMISLMPSVLSKIGAYEEGYDYAIFKDRITNSITEGLSSNVFMAHENGRIFTHPVSNKILNGCTRKRAIDILRTRGYIVEEKEFGEKEFLQAKEIFLTGAIKLFVPVESVNGNRIGDGKYELCSQCLSDYKNFAQSFLMAE